MVARDVCIQRRFVDCDKFTRNHFNTKVTLSDTFQHYLAIRPMTPTEAPAKVRGSTVLFTVAHCHHYFRWGNIAHFARELIPLANLADAYGHEIARHALVWEASRAQLVGASGGFITDWYVQTLASELLDGEHGTGAGSIYTCEQVPLTANAASALCFEELVAFREPQGCMPPKFTDSSSCSRFKSRVYQRLALAPTQASKKRVLVLIRTDSQGWLHHDEAAADIASYVEGAGGHAHTVFLNHSRMTLCEQVRWFMDAEVVVTTHGAHEMNLLFARQGSFHIEYFKRDHMSPAFSRVAVSCGLRYVAVHAEHTDFSRVGSRRFLNKREPLNFATELQPAMELALDVNGTHACPHLIMTARGQRCVAGWRDARAFYVALAKRAGHDA